MNVVFDRESLQVTGVGRNPLAFEVEINNVDPSGLTKTIQVPTTVDKLDADGNQLYLLPQKDLKIVSQVPTQVETPQAIAEDGTANSPIIIPVVKQVPVLDGNGNQVTYQPVSMQETTSTEDFYGNPTTPIMPTVVAIDGTTSEVQETDADGAKLYQGLMPSGNPLPVSTTEEVQEQKTDAQGNKLYYETVNEDMVTYQAQPDLEISQADTRWTDALLHATEATSQAQQVTFEANQNAFTFEDIMSAKASQIKGLYAHALLYEEMTEALFSTDASGFNADLGFGVVSLPAGGKIVTQAITLPASVSMVKVISESSQSLSITIGPTEADLQPLDAQFFDREFSTPVSTVYVMFENTNNTRTDLSSFALLF